MTRGIAIFFLAMALAACWKEGRAVRLGDNAYFFPANHISGIVDPGESDGGQYYIRLIPPGGYYWLVYDPRRESRRNTLGPEVPTISYISDWNLKVVPKEQQVRLEHNEAGTIVCKKYPVNNESAHLRQIFTCGFRIYDNVVPWSVIFPGDLASSAPALKKRAELTLADYRRDGRARSAR